MKVKRILKRIGCIIMTAVLTISSVCFENIARADSIAWTKVDGVFINSAGEEIEGAVLKGIDVSYHNGDIDWQQVKDSGIDYAIIRCGFGKDSKKQDDSKWAEYATACTELEIPFGTYLYSYATTVEAAESEARHALRVIAGYKLTYPVYYDMEDSKQKAVDAKEKAQMAKAFCSILEEAGYQTGIYANTNWFNNELTNSYFDTRDKWVAQYNSVCKYKGNYRMWQCTDEGRTPGISGDVDLNFWFDQPPVYQGNTPNNQTLPSNTDNNSETSTLDNNQIVQTIDNQGTQTPDSNQETENPDNSQTGIDETPPLNPDNNQEDNSEVQTIDNQEAENPDNSQAVQSPNTGNHQEIQKPEEVSKPKEPEEVVISQNTLTLSYGGTSVLTANQKVTWSSSDDMVVGIDSKGNVTPIGIGEAVIVAVGAEGKSAECKVTIKKPIKDVNIETIPDQQFTGKQIKPLPAIIDEERELVKGTDYKITYTDNMAKGTAIVTIKGKGYYTGSTTKNFQIIAKKKLETPTLTEISSQKNTVTLKWKKVSQAKGYEIYRAEKKNGEYILQKTITKKSKVIYKDKKLVRGKKYYYKIRAYKEENGKKQYSSYIKMKIKAAK